MVSYKPFPLDALSLLFTLSVWVVLGRQHSLHDENLGLRAYPRPPRQGFGPHQVPIADQKLFLRSRIVVCRKGPVFMKDPVRLF